MQMLTASSFNVKRITESNPSPFVLSNVSCVVDIGTGGTPTPVWGGSGTNFIDIDIKSGDQVTCTFNNGFVTAADASISGRVMTQEGRGINQAIVRVFNTETLETRFARTNQFGNYSLDGLKVGSTYIATVSHRRIVFSNNTQTFSLHENIRGLDFVSGNGKLLKPKSRKGTKTKGSWLNTISKPSVFLLRGIK